MTTNPSESSAILENGHLRVQIPRSFGPRVTHLQFHGSPNLLAELQDFSTRRPDGREYRFYGGHRLWVAAVEVTGSDLRVTIRKPPEAESGIAKTMTINMDEKKACIVIHHQLTNTGAAAIRCAPWAITQFRTGGTAILPQSTAQTGLLPNRLVALWPYTKIDGQLLTWGEQVLLLRAEKQPPFKIGFPNPRGWLGYWLEGCLFIKRFTYDPSAEYVDLGCSSECYCNHQFLELESLAPVTDLAPGESVSHTETWELYEAAKPPEDEKDFITMLHRIGSE
jgi:hypothetical protein